MAFENPQMYNSGTQADPSSIDAIPDQAQLNPFYYDRQAVIEANKKAYIGQLSGVRNQPKHAGKEIKKHLIVPMLDERNINDQGIDANGVVLDPTLWTSIKADGTVKYDNATEADAITEAGPDGTVKQTSGNLYGSSKDIATVAALTPIISETGGRVNRVGFSREILTSTLENYGFFYEFTADDLNFDSDPKLYSHLYRESGKAMGEMTEKSLMADLIYGAGIEIYAGGKTSVGDIVAGDKVTLAELRQMNKILNANLCPKDTQIISGSRNIDTKVVGSARYAYTSDDMIMTLEDIMNPITGKHMWAYVEEYSDGAKYAKSNVARGEVGKIANTRFIEHPEMLIFENKGDSAGGYGLDVHPILFVGSGSFTQIGFQTNGSKTKFNIIVKKPGKEVADRNNPYGKVGFVSAEYWYGVLIERSDWLAVVYASVV